MYKEMDIKKLFDQVKKSFREIDSKLEFRKMRFVGYSSPFTGNVQINPERIKKMSRDAVIGIIAHELAHQVSYRKRNFFSKWLWLWNYYLSTRKRRQVETEADKIAVERGYKKQVLAEIKETYKHFANDKKTLGFIKKAYPSPEEIRRMDTGKTN